MGNCSNRYNILFSNIPIRRPLYTKHIYPLSYFTRHLILALFFYWRHACPSQGARSVRSIDKIIKEGIYQRVRHPIYSGDIVLVWGIFSHWPSYRALSSVIWLTIILFFWMRLEEKALTEKFGRDYLEYKNRCQWLSRGC